MIIIESRHIMDAIREDCPLSISISLERITILPPTNSNSAFGIVRFEGSEKEIEVSAHWWVSVMPETTELVIKWLGKAPSDAPFSVEL